MIALALLSTFARLFVAYIFALAAALALAYLTTRDRRVLAFVLPFFDVMQSVPILAFFPLIVIFSAMLGSMEFAAFLLLFISMLWGLVFAGIAGIRGIPRDIMWASHVFSLRGRGFFRRVILPASFPQLATASLLAWAGAWNLIVVAEAVHAYLPGSTSASDLFGIGSVIAGASASGDHALLVAAMISLVMLIAVLDFAVWQPILNHAQKYRFE